MADEQAVLSAAVAAVFAKPSDLPCSHVVVVLDHTDNWLPNNLSDGFSDAGVPASFLSGLQVANSRPAAALTNFPQGFPTYDSERFSSEDLE